MNKTTIRIGIALVLTTLFIMACSKEDQAKSQKATTTSSLHLVVYKSPTCNCCTDWEQHMRNAGFDVESIVTNNVTQIKVENDIPLELQSCHTAFIDGYIIEGHVPAKDVIRLLKERPDIKGLTAPGMPQFSPGMQPEGLKPAGYDVLAFDDMGNTNIFSSYRKPLR